MKKEIHPSYEMTTFQCACGAATEVRSTMGGTVAVDICASCHPFYTGKQKLVDTAGRIDRFKKKFGSRMNVLKKKKEKFASQKEAIKGKKVKEENKTDKAKA